VVRVSGVGRRGETGHARPIVDVNLLFDVRVVCRAAPLWMVSGWA